MSRKQRINVTEIANSIADDDPSYRQGRISSHLRHADYVQVSTIRDVEAEAAPEEWTPKKIERRLVEAARVVEITTSRPGPRGHRSYWPESYRFFEDEFGQIWREYPSESDEKPRLQATSSQINRADEAVGWAKKYVKDQRVLMVFREWLRVVSLRKRRYDEEKDRFVPITWSWTCQQRGWALATADRCRDRAKAEIIAGLRRDRIIVK